ncbi:unknown [Spodoptera litura nucleopolyhedrovirus]|uniref:Uncharacterized protein n=1 Tax=Spodoptera litura multicapsid nucleopolyhedrovirus TaxID=46242 RepID=Q9EN65_NPVST|nr:hypothetical protein [Spodoptera litura nucleopolyhedrovirus]AAG02377.1 unknown [Spodoptera litura nucleopolyhedrovirus]AAL01825.1 unknown [Spodoptera litura nucleopolyhedrovirus]ABY84882.1 unknown protein [Spodoptera litura nucleopolyhedrovirus]QHN73891.1 hypothetical protein [Spodoptera litura nucleopolyhedrovirus]
MPLLFLLIQPTSDAAAVTSISKSKFSKISHKIRCMTIRRCKGVKLKYKNKKRIF